MKKICRVFRPEMVWVFELEPDFNDYVYPNVEEPLIALMKKYDITYDDMDVIISTEFIEDHDLVFKFSHMFKPGGSYFKLNNNDCYFADYFTKHFNITEDTEYLYMKVIPLLEL